MTAPGPTLSFKDDDPVSRRAADYFQRRRFWEWTDADQAELDAWLAESMWHRAAYLRLEGIAAHARDLAAIRPLKLRRRWLGDVGPLANRRFVIPLLAAASIALFAAIGVPFVTSLMQPPDRTYSTDVGGRTLLKFADGTVADLDTDTAARFRMTSGERTVWLEKGEAWFHVAHDAANPFTVVVGQHRIADIGTEFLVRRNADGVEVALLNGRASLSTEGAAVAMLAPGDDAVATRVSVAVTRRTPQQLTDALAWRHGMLVFRNTKLSDAVREINRYNAIKLTIVDPSIVELKFTGEIKDDNVEDFLVTAQSLMGVRADRRGNDILLSRETQEKAGRIKHAKHKP